MEVSNRFELLASLSADKELEESSIVHVTSSQQQKQVINVEQKTQNHWEIPEYVEKSIPCSPLLITTAETSSLINLKKTSSSKQRTKSSVDTTISEDQDDEILLPSMNEAQNLSNTRLYYPPQPYKFKQSLSNHRNQAMPKFDRKPNNLPKLSSSRGNSKACTHKI